MRCSPAEQLSSNEGLDVLIVDDNQLTLDIASWILRKSDVRYQLCSDPEEALQTLTETIPRVLVVDYFMPDTNGIELLMTFSKMHGSHGCSMYLCSALEPMPEQLEKLTEIGGKLLDKEALCNRASLLELVETPLSVVNR